MKRNGQCTLVVGLCLLCLPTPARAGENLQKLLAEARRHLEHWDAESALAHRYFFTVYALRQELELAPGLSREQLLEAIKGYVLARGRLIGTYER